MAARDAILKSPLDPAAIDLLNATAADATDPTYLLAVRAGGNAAAIAATNGTWRPWERSRVPAGDEESILARNPGFHAAIPWLAPRWRGGAGVMYSEGIEGSDAIRAGTGDRARRIGRLLRLLRQRQ